VTNTSATLALAPSKSAASAAGFLRRLHVLLEHRPVERAEFRGRDLACMGLARIACGLERQHIDNHDAARMTGGVMR
jgi:hypothetical protein